MTDLFHFAIVACFIAKGLIPERLNQKIVVNSYIAQELLTPQEWNRITIIPDQ